MKKYVFFIVLHIFLSSCGKIVDGSKVVPPNYPTESPVNFSVNVDPGAGNILAVVGTSQIINIKISSILPVAGVTIAISVIKDLDNSTVFTLTNSTITADNNINITGLTPGVLCTANVIVSSKSSATNTKTSSVKIVAK